MNFLILLAIIMPVLSGAGLLFSKLEDSAEIRNFTTAVLAFTAAVTVVSNILNFGSRCSMLNLPMGMSIAFSIDWLAAFFSTMFAAIWLIVGIYSREYFKTQPNEKRFLGFYLMALGAVIGVSFAANPFTFYTFFEMMSLTSFVFVLNNQSKESIAAAKKYIYYSIFGALCGLVAIMAFYGSNLIRVKEFTAGGSLVMELGGRMPIVALITFIAILGFSCKAGMFPLHSWIPYAYVQSPAPASAVLSGAIAKTGVLAIIRIVYFVVGADVLRGSWVQFAVLALSITTIFMGSMMAYKEKLFQRRVAYSSVSQVSYAVFGVMTLSAFGLAGAVLQILFHALSKNVLFLTSGAITYKTGKRYVSELTGLGKAMPKTFALFTLAGMSLAGVPLTGGFVSKFCLAQAALNGNFAVLEFIGFIIIMVSALLTAGYIWSVSSKALFAHKDLEICENCDINATMFVPMLILTVLIFAMGIFPDAVLGVIADIAASVM
ncbi:MAG: proton-conducting membrane transporter [Oscillospiraceae bacterium]|nr:proton-conducting membrane transporter [Oscillospiraceae bacterium]